MLTIAGGLIPGETELLGLGEGEAPRKRQDLRKSEGDRQRIATHPCGFRAQKTPKRQLTAVNQDTLGGRAIALTTGR